MNEKLVAFISGVSKQKPKLSELIGFLTAYQMVNGDVSFDELMGAFGFEFMPEAKPEDVEKLPTKKRSGKEVKEAVIKYLATRNNATFKELHQSCSFGITELGFRYHINQLLECGAIIHPEYGRYALSKVV